jgi:hypothetical protein
VERVAEPAEVLRERHLQIPGGLQLVEIFLAELVVAIVSRGPLSTGLEKRIRKQCAGRHSHLNFPFSAVWGGNDT